MIYPEGTPFYRHYKGRYYKFLYVAEHTETHERLVVYEALYGYGGIFVRSYDMFFGMVSTNQGEVRRFEPVDSSEVENLV